MIVPAYHIKPRDSPNERLVKYTSYIGEVSYVTYVSNTCMFHIKNGEIVTGTINCTTFGFMWKPYLNIGTFLIIKHWSIHSCWKSIPEAVAHSALPSYTTPYTTPLTITKKCTKSVDSTSTQSLYLYWVTKPFYSVNGRERVLDN